MSTIEGGMVCTDDPQVYQNLRMLRSHGMVREASDPKVSAAYQKTNPELTPDFIFAFPSYNVRNTEIGGILGRSQLKRLDENVNKRNQNLMRFLNQIDPIKYRTDFKLEGCSNYAFNLILNQADDDLVKRLQQKMRDYGIEFRRGSSGGGNQLRQPYLKEWVPEDYYREFPECEHIHFYGFYIGNFPDLRDEEIDNICLIINSA
jgi:CDP-6-deoxy-D-xylo-4-hexulose-3-dehydrase